MGSCQYRFNASEHYQRTPPGCAPETHCGAQTYPIYDEPEIIYRRVQNPDGTLGIEPIETGVLLPRAADDPHCPEHGGTPAPEPGMIRMFLQRELDTKRAEIEAIQAQLEGTPQAQPVRAELVAGTAGPGPLSLRVESQAYDPGEHTVPEVVAYLRTADAAELSRVLDAERRGQARKGILGEFGEDPDSLSSRQAMRKGE